MRSLSVLLALLLAGSLTAADKPTEVALASGGKAELRLVVAGKASPAVQRAAKTLGDYLHTISGAPFQTIDGDGTTDIAIGLPAHFPKLPFQKLWDAKDPTQREDFLLRSHAHGLYVLGATDKAVEHAVWELLYRLGHRQFFPGPTWEVVPSVKELKLAVDVTEHPSFHSRRIWYGFGPWDYAEKPYAEWCARNRAVSGIDLHTGHAYDGILKRNQAVFKDHPEYLGLVDGQRKSSKFCTSNPELRALIVKDALAQFKAKPELESISLDPSDGGGWCQCAECKKMGSVSDRALTLANDVAKALEKDYPDRYVGMYAYSEHSPPPALAVHPRVVVSVATAFIRGGFTVDQLLAGWHKQKATLGLREYYSVSTWDRDLPGAARGGNLQYLRTTIPHYHANGARFYSAESSDNWGPNGLGYYLAARMLWDVRAAGNLDALVADFLDKAFGTAREPMKAFYQLLDGSKKSQLSEDLIGRMYRLLAESRQKSDDGKVRARLDDLLLYTRYVELWLAYSSAEGARRQEAFEAVIRHTYRMRTTMMVHSKALYRDVAARDKSVSIPTEAAWGVPEARNPWKSSKPFTREELDKIQTAGGENNRLLDFTPVAFSDTLVPATPLKLAGGTPGTFGNYSRGQRVYYTWVEEKEGTLAAKAKAGLVYDNRGAAKITLYPVAEPEGKAVARVEVEPNKQEHAVELKTTFTGLHRLEINDASAGTSLIWPEGKPLTLCSSRDQPATLPGRWSLYFYVPRGTKVVGGFASGQGSLRDGSGKEIHKFESKPGYFSVKVPPGQDGTLWQFHQSQGQRLLMTVPPYLARSAAELLLPAEVIKADAKK